MLTNTRYSSIGLDDGGCLHGAGIHCCKISPLAALNYCPFILFGRRSVTKSRLVGHLRFTTLLKAFGWNVFHLDGHHILSMSLRGRTRHVTMGSSQICAPMLSWSVLHRKLQPSCGAACFSFASANVGVFLMYTSILFRNTLTHPASASPWGWSLPRSNPIPGEMRQNDLSCVSGGPLRDIETCDPISCGCGPRDAIPTQVKTNSANQHETDGFFQHKSGGLGQIGCIPETWAHRRGSSHAKLPLVVASTPFQAFLCTGEAVPAVGKCDTIVSRRRAR
jgi:hypothetical protein